MLLSLVACVLQADVAAACDMCRRLSIATDDSLLHELAPVPPATVAFADGADDSGGVASATFSGLMWPQAKPGDPVHLTYSYRNMFDGGLLMPNGQPLPADLIRRSIERALAVWAAMVPIHFREVEDDGLPYHLGSTKFGQIRFHHQWINGPDPAPPALPIAKAMASFPGVDVYAGDVYFDNGDRWQEVGTTPQPDILGATIHELGHSLGLLHSANPASNMYWIFTRYNGPDSDRPGALHPDDIASIRAVYGTGVGSVTTMAIPEPAAWLLIVWCASAVAFWRRRHRSKVLLRVEIA